MDPKLESFLNNPVESLLEWSKMLNYTYGIKYKLDTKELKLVADKSEEYRNMFNDKVKNFRKIKQEDVEPNIHRYIEDYRKSPSIHVTGVE